MTAETCAGKLALSAPAWTVTEEGTETKALFDARFTTVPPDGAFEFRVTVQLSVPAPLIDAIAQPIEASGAEPFPCSLTCADKPDWVDTVSLPSAEPTLEGLNLRSRLTDCPGATISGRGGWLLIENSVPENEI